MRREINLLCAKAVYVSFVGLLFLWTNTSNMYGMSPKKESLVLPSEVTYQEWISASERGNLSGTYQSFNSDIFGGNFQAPVLRLDGIGGDDNALGEEPASVEDGLLILSVLSVLLVFNKLKHKFL